jgi:hypothetical protein
MRWMASLPNFRPSVVIASLLEKSHHAPAPSNANRIIKIPMTCPDEFDREFIFEFCILAGETKTNAFDHLTITNERAMSLFARVSAKAISGINFKMDEVAVEMLTLLP